MARLVLTAENFAFGPIGKLLYVADLLKDKGHTLVFAGYGTSLQLAKKFPFADIHEVDTDDPKSNSALEVIISQADALISSMDVSSVIVAKRLKKPVVWIDCLFWFWDNIPEVVFDVDLYITERSLDDSVNEVKFGPKIKNMYSVGPIIGKIKRKKRKNQVLVSFGGGEALCWYKVGVDTNYPFIMTSILSSYANWTHFEQVLLVTSERIIGELEKGFPKIPFKFVTLPHDKFLEEMSQSEVILITPGLITAEAAFYSSTPTIFLPPSNNSQYLQLEEFRRLGLATASVHLADFMPGLNLKGMPIRKSTQKMLQQLREFELSPEVQVKVGTKINELVKDRKKWSTEFIKKGKEFIASLGGNGVEASASRIVQLLKDKGIK
jgi:hypothetical protein